MIRAYDRMRPTLRKGYLVQKKRFLKGVLEGYLIKWLRPNFQEIEFSKKLKSDFSKKKIKKNWDR